MSIVQVILKGLNSTQLLSTMLLDFFFLGTLLKTHESYGPFSPKNVLKTVLNIYHFNFKIKGPYSL